MSSECADYQNLPAKIIALANAALPDGDPRKITRAMIERLRLAASTVFEYDSTSPDVQALAAFVGRHADALEAYLPPHEKQGPPLPNP